MISGFTKYLLFIPLIWICPFTRAQIDIDLGLFAETRVSFFNDSKSGLPLTFEKDDNWNTLAFYPTDWGTKNNYGFGFYFNGNIYNGFYFGMKGRVNVDHLVISGYSDYTDAYYTSEYGTFSEYQTAQAALGNNVTQSDYEAFISDRRLENQHAFSLTNRLVDFSGLDLSVGYRWSIYKTIRPYTALSIRMSSWDETVVNRTVEHPHFIIAPSFFNAVSSNVTIWDFTLTAGVEIQSYKVYTGLSTSLNQVRLFSNNDYYGGDESVSLPFSKYVHLSFGVARRMRSIPRKEEPPTGHGGAMPHSRKLKRWQFGVSLNASMNSLDDNGYVDVNSIRITEEQVGNITRERLYFQKVILNRSNSFQQPISFGSYLNVHHNAFFAGVEGKLHQTTVQWEGDQYQGEFYEIPGGDFFHDEDKWNFSTDALFVKKFNHLSVNAKAGYIKGFGAYVGLGRHVLLSRKKFPQDVNINPTPLYEELNNLLDGTFNAQSNPDYYILEGDYNGYYRESGEFALESVLTEYDRFEDSRLAQETRSPTFNTFILGFAFNFNRITASLEMEFAMQKSFRGRGIIGGYDAIGAHLQYMLFGK